MNPNKRHPQFMPAASTGVVAGNMVKTNIGTNQQSAKMLIGKPHFPREYLLTGKGSPLMRLRATQPMLMVYEDRMAAKSMARMAFRAATEPMLIIDKPMQTKSETMIALRGMLQRG